MVIPPIYSTALNFSEGLAAVGLTSGEGSARQTRWGFIDRTGKMVIAPEYSEDHSFAEGLAAVRISPTAGTDTNGKWGFVDKKGQVLIPPMYSSALDFSRGVAAVYGSPRDQEKWRFIDKRGQTVSPSAYTTLPAFSEGLAPLRLTTGKLGFVDEQGRLMTTAFPFDETTKSSIDSPFRSQEVESTPYDDLKLEVPEFSSGRYPVRVRKKWGYIDKHGRLVIAPRFDIAGNFREGLASVTSNGRAGFIEPQGKYVIPPKFRFASDFSDGLALVFQAFLHPPSDRCR
jgi:hypothetical protein